MRTRSRNPVHRVTSAHLQSAYPFAAASGGWAPGIYVGDDVCGGGSAFCYDPWELYAAGLLTNPNMLVTGQVGRGKSALVKSYCARSLVFGRRVIVLDRKGEFARLCEAAETQPIRLEPGGRVRLNPLEARGGGSVDDIRRDRIDALIALGGAARRGGLLAAEKAALSVALDRAVAEAAGDPTLPDVVRALLAPRDEDAAQLAMSARELAEGSRDVALELRRLVDGELRGMFDGPTTPGINLAHQLVVFDISGVADTVDALSALMVCVAAWVRRSLQRESDDARRSIFVLEEAWACLASLEVARWMRGLQKLSRQYGVQVVLVLHRFSDLLAAGAEGSEAVAVARGLLSDTETHVVHGMPASEVAATKELLALTDTEAEIVGRLPRGRALWRVRGRSFVVDLRLSRLEEWICDTDARCRPSVSDGSGGHAAQGQAAANGCRGAA